MFKVGDRVKVVTSLDYPSLEQFVGLCGSVIDTVPIRGHYSNVVEVRWDTPSYGAPQVWNVAYLAMADPFVAFIRETLEEHNAKT